MREAIPLIAVAAMMSLAIGAAAMYFLMPAQAPHRPDTTAAAPVSGGEPETKPLDNSEAEIAASKKAAADLQTLLDESRQLNTKLEDQVKALEADKQTLQEDKARLEADNKTVRAELKGLKDAAAAGPSTMLIDFGKWSEVKELRETDWADLGDAYAKMTPLLQEYAAAIAQGKQPDAETVKNIQEQNSRLIAFYARVMKKLPTNSASNGEFTHPINLVNILAAQLAEAGLPLSDAQKSELSELGGEYDRKWDALNAAYTETTWTLQKVVDEGELKQWFYEKMFEITTVEQRNAAVPSDLQGLIGLDLYSPGLMLQGYMDPLREADITTLKGSLKESVGKFTGIPKESLDGAEYIFDDWLNALQLQPMSQLELRQWRTLPVLKAARAQLSGMRALDQNVAVDEETHKKFRFASTILVPQLVKQE